MRKPKKKIEVVYYLIRRMSRTEKRHFKLHNQIYKGKNKDFVKLFDFLNNLQVFDTKRINNFIEKEKITQKHICISYLLDKITASICSIDRGPLYTTAEAKIQAYLDRFHVYYKTELQELAYKELEKAEREASSYGMHGKLIDVYKKQAWIVQANQFIFDDSDKITEIYQKAGAAVKQQSLLYEINEIAARILGKSTDTDTYKIAISDLNEFTQKNEDNIAPEGKSNIHIAWFFEHFNHLAFEDAAKSAQKVIEIYNESPYLIEINTRIYIVQWHNLIVSHIRANNAETAYQLYQNLECIPERYKQIINQQPDAYHILAYHRFTCHRIELMLIFERKNYDTVNVFEKKVESSLEEFPDYFNSSKLNHIFFLQLSYALVLTKAHKKAQDWLEKLPTSDILRQSDILLEEMEILKLIICYDYQGEVLMESLTRSLERKWKNQSPQSRYTEYMLDLLKSLIRKKNRKKLNEILKLAHERAIHLEQEVYHLLPFSYWIEQKI